MLRKSIETIRFHTLWSFINITGDDSAAKKGNLLAVDKITKKILFAGLLLRLLMIIFGFYFFADFTDIDYHIISDAARYVSKGDSPFARNTYRYSPLIAFLLQPNNILPYFGKVLFSVADVVLVFALHVISSHQHKHSIWGLLCWSLNPLVASICTRGSFDSISNCFVVVMVATCLFRYYALCGIVVGLAIHLRLYPLIFVPTLLLHASHPLPLLSPSFYLKKWDYYRKMVNTVAFRNASIFLCCLLAAFGMPTLYFYKKYGQEYVSASFLYHIRRVDIRHNFSPLYYAIYLSNDGMPALSLLPQMFLIVIATFSLARQDVILTVYVISHVFVIFNKVSTAQYFTWYGCLVPLLLSRVHVHIFFETFFLALFWILSLCLWLWNAYILEFRGENYIFYVWVCSMLFLVANSMCIVYIIAMLR